MKWFKKLFKPKSLGHSDRKYFEGYDAFLEGKKLMEPEVTHLSGGNIDYRRKNKEPEALKLFDEAIEKGYNEADVFTFRGMCLDNLGFHFDAIEDYNKSILKNSQKADVYFARSIIKHAICDYEGSEMDVKEAIRLSKFDNDNNQYWNSWYQQVGYNSATQSYEEHLNFLNRFYLNERDNKTEKWKKLQLEKERKVKLTKRRKTDI